MSERPAKGSSGARPAKGKASGKPAERKGASKDGRSARSSGRKGSSSGSLGGGAASFGGGPRAEGEASAGVRRMRLGGTIHKQLASELSRSMADPRLAPVGIERVELTPDLSIAKVWVRLMYGEATDEARATALATLARASSGLRASLGPVLRMRRVPELRFHYDEGADQRAHIEGILSAIKREEEEKRRGLDPRGLASSDAAEPPDAAEPSDAAEPPDDAES